jgi:hypothetical protein
MLLSFFGAPDLGSRSAGPPIRPIQPPVVVKTASNFGNDALSAGSFIVSGIGTCGQQKRQEHNQPKACISSSNHSLPSNVQKMFSRRWGPYYKRIVSVSLITAGYEGRHPSEPCLTALGPAKLPPQNGMAGSQSACRNQVLTDGRECRCGAKIAQLDETKHVQ